MVDLHCHILPDMDDGSPSWDETLQMAEIAVADGISDIVCSPHQCDGFFNVEPRRVREAVTELAARLKREGIDLRVHPGGDIRLQPSLPDDLAADRVNTIGDGGRYLLVELAPDLFPPGVEETFFALRLRGYVPILTHPERNAAIQAEVQVLESLVQAGVLLQVTAGAFTRRFGVDGRRCARRIARRGWLHIVASDAHDAEDRAPALSEARRQVETEYGVEVAELAFCTNPSHVLAGGAVALENPPRPRPLENWCRRLLRTAR